jgi:tRNA threonylcarbamoyladenosine biosynthesis protein TsaE
MRIRGLNEMEELAKDFVNNLDAKESATVIGLKGNLGSGKTTFSPFVAKELGVEEQITSPTFVIQKRYDISNNDKFDTLIHIDAYRLNSGEELKVLDWENTIKNPKTLVLLEWPEKVSDVLENIDLIEFEYINEEEREVEIKNAN